MIESIQHRRSIRKYLPEPVSPEKLRAVLEAGRLSPSGNNKQPWQFIVIQSAQQRQAVMEVCHNQTWMMTAPAFIIAVADIAAGLALLAAARAWAWLDGRDMVLPDDIQAVLPAVARHRLRVTQGNGMARAEYIASLIRAVPIP